MRGIVLWLWPVVGLCFFAVGLCFFAVGLCFFAVGLFSNWLIHWPFSQQTKIVAECPPQEVVQKTEVVERTVVELSGWECTAPEGPEGRGSDLMQPTGYWALDIVSCFKLITPISEWCAEHDPLGKRCTAEQMRGDLDPKP